MKTLLACLLLFSLPLLAADATGIWSGTLEFTGPNGETKRTGAHMSLKQTGTEITGTAGPGQGKQWQVRNGKIDGNTITFEVQSDGPLMHFQLTLDGDHLKGEAKVEHQGENLKATLDLARKAD